MSVNVLVGSSRASELEALVTSTDPVVVVNGQILVVNASSSLYKRRCAPVRECSRCCLDVVKVVLKVEGQSCKLAKGHKATWKNSIQQAANSGPIRARLTSAKPSLPPDFTSHAVAKQFPAPISAVPWWYKVEKLISRTS